jgi:hypothetical protein
VPAGNTYVEITNQTLTSAASSVTFSSIPSTYTDLILIIQAKSASGNNAYVRFGDGAIDTGSNYSYTGLAGNGSSAYSDRYTNQTRIQLSYFATITNDFNYISATHIQNYANTVTNKTILIRHSQAADGAGATAGLWRSTAAINTININRSNVDFEPGSTFALYGITAA